MTEITMTRGAAREIVAAEHPAEILTILWGEAVQADGALGLLLDDYDAASERTPHGYDIGCVDGGLVVTTQDDNGEIVQNTYRMDYA